MIGSIEKWSAICHMSDVFRHNLASDWLSDFLRHTTPDMDSVQAFFFVVDFNWKF